MTNKTEKKISFCTSCRNRLWQIQQTLQKNLADLDSAFEITLIDYGSTDGLSKWIWDNFRKFIDEGKLNFFEVQNDVNWNASKAKNLAHRLANGSYFFNLDADNFISPRDVELIFEAQELNYPCHQWSDSWNDGSFGRIGLPKALFLEIGGYDETMLPMGGQDMDLLNRIHFLGLSIAKLPAPTNHAIQNSYQDKIKEIVSSVEDPGIFYKSMDDLNFQKSKVRLDIEGAIRKDGYATYKGLLNGSPLIINGFNQIQLC